MSNKQSFWATLPGCLTLIFIAVIGYSLVRDHSSHLVQWLPFSIILLCPFMHFFMHRGHGHSDHSGSTQSPEDYKKGYADALRDQQQDTDSTRSPSAGSEK